MACWLNRLISDPVAFFTALSAIATFFAGVVALYLGVWHKANVSSPNKDTLQN
jgi:hypothetical protein